MSRRNTRRALIFSCLIAPLLAACGTNMPEIKPVDHVDIPKFMGDWYVIANIPTFLEKGAHNAVENYSLNDDGTIATTFTFRDGSFDGKLKTYTPKGFVTDHPSNAIWGMRFIWPIKADYRIIYLDDIYSTTVIGRNKRDYVWLMAREPDIDQAKYDELLQLIGDVGYDLTDIRRVPQQW
ncbi:MAG: lipocalin family protein [Woeseia sp.]|nr:lipocalin family protein [Woeseia sp.]